MGRSFLEVRFLNEKIGYDGSQLSPHWIYSNTGIMGDAAVSFIGKCNVPETHMVDLEDLLGHQSICSDEMLHFIVEIFSKDALFAAALQTVFVSEIQNALIERDLNLRRRGDDLFISDAKLSISIATVSTVSSLIHIGLNISNEGTPVKTSCLLDQSIDPKSFAEEILTRFDREYSRIILASSKVRPRI